ncbi:hypothetical protein M8J76_014769 [Diaphorina citri]|nr:hypothetical protein M8J76_014769 [Diaphorina citri]
MKMMTGVPSNFVTDNDQGGNSVNNIDSNELGPYGDDSQSEGGGTSSELTTSSDSDTELTPESDDDQIDLELLHRLDEIHISSQCVEGASDTLTPKGPQKTHKIRKQGKSSSVPYQQGSSVLRHVVYPQSGGRVHSGYDGEDHRVDMVLSESLNDPGFRTNLLYTLQAEVEQYPKPITPPLSSSDSTYPADYNSGYTSSSSNYYEYTPESLDSASPQGSDVSLEDETSAYLSSNHSNSCQSTGDQYIPNNHLHYHLNPSGTNISTNLLSPPISDASPQGLQEDDYRNEVSVPRLSPLRGDSNLSGGDKTLCTADKFIDNMCHGVKYFLASHKRNPADQIDPYMISEDRTQSLLALARVIHRKLDSLKEVEKRMVVGSNPEDGGFMTGTGVYEYL